MSRLDDFNHFRDHMHEKTLAEGHLEQVGSPAELLDHPESTFLQKLLAAELIQVRR
ncbi:MAG: hypothetical protein IIA60_14050 [Candidatus Marinimicrobia bacterium]|nr:hypothetical protein [Candidatus Neomarinimicrobiota bacterium]